MPAMSDCRFPTEGEESTLIEGVSEMFVATGMESKPIPLIPDEFVKLLFAINSDTFGGRLEKEERRLLERIEKTDQERKEDQTRQIRKFLCDFPPPQCTDKNTSEREEYHV